MTHCRGCRCRQVVRWGQHQIDAQTWNAWAYIQGALESTVAIADGPHAKPKALLRLCKRLEESAVDTSVLRDALVEIG